jgi:hypothetical protein
MKERLKQSPLLTAIITAIIVATLTTIFVITKSLIFESAPVKKQSIDFSAGNYEDCFYDYSKLYALYEYSANNPDDNDAKKWIEQYEKNLTISEKLPVNRQDNGDYSIQYETNINYPDCERLYCIVIYHDSAAALKSAKNYIKSIGYNPDDFEIKDIKDSSTP